MLVFQSVFPPLLSKNVNLCCTTILDYLAPTLRDVVVKRGNALPHILNEANAA